MELVSPSPKTSGASTTTDELGMGQTLGAEGCARPTGMPAAIKGMALDQPAVTTDAGDQPRPGPPCDIEDLDAGHESAAYQMVLGRRSPGTGAVQVPVAVGVVDPSRGGPVLRIRSGAGNTARSRLYGRSHDHPHDRRRCAGVAQWAVPPVASVQRRPSRSGPDRDHRVTEPVEFAQVLASPGSTIRGVPATGNDMVGAWNRGRSVVGHVVRP